MKKIYALFFVLILSSCHQKIVQEDLSKLNGYWEIEKVVLPDGIEKAYAINETFDYFQIQSNKGFRKKVKPQFNGRFLVDDQSEKVEISIDQEQVLLFYSTPYAKWKETLVVLTDDNLVLVNKAKIAYHYKKVTPIQLLNDGKKTK